MKTPRLLAVCTFVAFLAGCSAFKSPSASQERRNERGAQVGESRRAEFDRDQAINHRASTYERQGMSKEQARSAAEAEYPGLRPPR